MWLDRYHRFQYASLPGLHKKGWIQAARSKRSTAQSGTTECHTNSEHQSTVATLHSESVSGMKVREMHLRIHAEKKAETGKQAPQRSVLATVGYYTSKFPRWLKDHEDCLVL